MPNTKRNWIQRSAPRYLYSGFARWTGIEYDFLNVDDEVKPWRDMLDLKRSEEELWADKNLQKILTGLGKEARNYTEEEVESMCMTRDSFHLGDFYKSIRRGVVTTARDEFEKDVMEDIPTPRELKLIRYDRAVKSRTPCCEDAIPEASLLQSVSSVSSDTSSTRESLVRQAFFSLLYYIRLNCSGKLNALDIDRQPFEGVIRLKRQPKAIRVKNDGCIRMTKSKLGHLPFLNIECKSRAGSSSADVHQKIFAQEFGESLAIMLARLKATEGLQKCPSYTVYSIGVHHRRAYLARVDFDPKYLQDCVNGVLNERRVTVTRSERNYRLDDVMELRELVTMICCLCQQFVSEISAGRLA